MAHQVKIIPVEKGVIRDFYHVHADNADYVNQVYATHKVVGLDWACFNLGGAPVTVILDDTHEIPVPGGGYRSMSDIKFAAIAVESVGVDYQLIVAGVYYR